MNFDSLMASFLSDQQAVLPSTLVQYAGLYGAWTLVLAWGAAALTRRWSPRYGWGVVLVVAFVTVVPGLSSPAYWLGLAFQSPSLSSLLLAIGGLIVKARTRPMKASADNNGWVLVACAVGASLGWLLLLDTLAWWPISVYAWGFSPSAVAVLASALAIGWTLLGGARTGSTRGLVLSVPSLALVIFVITRWPTGNVWDALLDPWLWVGLHVALFISGLRARRQRVVPTIPA